MSNPPRQGPYGQPDPFSDHDSPDPRSLGYQAHPQDPFASTPTLNSEFGGRHQPDFDDDDEEEKMPLSQGQSGFAGGFYPPA